MTTGKEDGNAAYTRDSTVIIPITHRKDLKDTIAHEMFHVYSKNNKEKRPDIYGIIGYKEIEEIEYPRKFIDRKLTNPDAYENNYAIGVTEKNTK